LKEGFNLKYFFPIIIFSAAIGYVFPPWNDFINYVWLFIWLALVPAAASFVWWYERKEQKY